MKATAILRENILNVIGNIIFISLIYLVLGTLVSYIVSVLSPDFTEEWKKQHPALQFLDISAEVSLLSILAFLSSYFVDNIVPYLPVHESFEDYIESFGGRMIFIYMIFIFVKDLDEKLIYMYTNVLGARVSTPPATGAHKS
jgi:hypothetical protein